MVIISTPFVLINYCIDSNGILVQWKARPSLNAFKEAYLNILAFLEGREKITHYCTDLTKVGSLNVEEENWLASVYYPKVYNLIQEEIYVAVVFSEEHFQAMIHNYHASRDRVEPNFMQFHYFTSPFEAWHWLSSMQKGQNAVPEEYAS